MANVIGIDLGTSAVKVLVVSPQGQVLASASAGYALHQPHPGWCEQDPKDWVRGVITALRQLGEDGVDLHDIAGVSYSGQMHGLVLLDAQLNVLRPAILWNDTRTTAQVGKIRAAMGEHFVEITGNQALEGFTLPKLLWVQEHEPQLFAKAAHFLLPKDYVRLCMTDELGLDLSDAAGTVMLDMTTNDWSQEILDTFDLRREMCPPLVEASAQTGVVSDSFAAASGLQAGVAVFAGGADNACGAIGAGILTPQQVMLSIGTSGVVLAYETGQTTQYGGRLHWFNHAVPGRKYSMGVTLAAGYSLSWFKQTVAGEMPFDDFVKLAEASTPGANGLVFTPYIVGERTPYADANIRGSFIGLDGRQQLGDMVRAVMEGIIYSFKDLLALYAQAGRTFSQAVAIGGGAQSPLWLQMQADILGLDIVTQASNQGPGMGAAMIAAVGCGWFEDFQACAQAFLQPGTVYHPDAQAAKRYAVAYQAYQQVYAATKAVSETLAPLR